MEAAHQETEPAIPIAVVAGEDSGEDSVIFFEPEQQGTSKAAFDLFWEVKFEELNVFRVENGHCCVSQKSSKKEEQLSNNLLSLGAWVKEQRQQHKKDKLSEEVPPN